MDYHTTYEYTTTLLGMRGSGAMIALIEQEKQEWTRKFISDECNRVRRMYENYKTKYLYEKALDYAYK